MGLRAAEIQLPLIHAAGSAATLHLPGSHLDMVRCGLALYGIAPGQEAPLPPGFLPALQWKTTVVQVKRVPAGALVGFGGVPAGEGRALTLAVLPVGFQDGFSREPRTWAEVLIKGQRAPLFGQVSAYQCLIDVSQIDDVRMGDEVVLLGRQGADSITVEAAAQALEITPYELLAQLMPRTPRAT
ncbi:MAG: hypothetical protein HC915_05725 [Anaerolineae bacterium]|nr:hypothetical protein [Anaerolineae bacterium]